MFHLPRFFYSRFSVNRGESRFMSPIKVNTKIRHIYSHITSTTTSDEPSGTISTRSRTTSRQSSIHSASTHTQTEEDDNEASLIIQSVDEETAMDMDDLRRDAFTSMSPPPTPTPLQLISADTPLARSLPPAYAGKLEDLEKITGHIVIQRFFTRADEAFGFWLEKQLGMNVKSVSVGREEDTVEPIPTATPSPPPLHPNLESFTGSGIDNLSAKRMRESRILEKIIEVDDILGGEEIIADSSKGEIFMSSEPSPEKKDKECSVVDNVKCECFLEQFNNVRKSSVKISVDKIEGLSKMEQDIIDQCIAVEIIRGKQNIEHVQTDSRLENEILEKQIPENDYSTDRPCIPDVIDVSQFYKTQAQPQSHSEDAKTETTNEDSEELKTVVSNQSSLISADSQLESQYKVVEYLGKLEISSPVNDASTSANSLNSELDWVGSGAPDEEIKRSISVDSCIGTESSGERNMLNDSGILLDSSRMDMHIPEEEDETSCITGMVESTGQEKLADDAKCDLSELPTEDKSAPEISRPNRPAVSQNQSIDDSTNYSRSDVSSVALNKQVSDEGGDADQSESESELCSLQEQTLDEDPRLPGQEEFQRLEETEVEDTSGLLVDEDDDDEDNCSQPDELDQFDTIIENHEKEKRLRPIYRKRNVSTQTSKTVESSSTVSCTTGSRCTTASSDSSSFDLEFISKSKKYISHHVPSKQQAGDEMGVRKRSYLPTGGTGLNVLNMKFSMGREFESEVSIRIPAKSPTASSVISSSSSFNYQNLPNAIIPPSDKQSNSKGNKKSQTQSQFPAIGGTFTKEHYRTRHQGPSSSTSVTMTKLLPIQQQQDPELKTLWKDVKSRMDSRVETDLQVTGSKINLITSAEEASASMTNSATTMRQSRTGGGDQDSERATKLPLLISSSEQEKLKRSLQRIKRILDD